MGGYLYNRLFYIFIYFVREHMSDRRSDRLPLSGLRSHQGGIFGPHSGLSRRMGDAALYLPIILWLAAAFVQRYVCLRARLFGWMKWAGILLICGMIVFYVISMCRYFPDRAPYIYHSDNLIQKIVIYRQLW